MKKILIASLLTAVLTGCIGYVPGHQSYWDAQVREMCGKDGGVKIIETVRLNRQQYSLLLNKFGQLSPPLENKAGENVPIVHRFTAARHALARLPEHQHAAFMDEMSEAFRPYEDDGGVAPPSCTT